MSDSPRQLSNAKVSVFSLNSTGPIAALGVVQLDSSGGILSGGAGAGSTQVSIKEILTSSGASVMDSTEGAIKVNVVAGAAGGSTYVSVRQSTAADLNAAVVQGSTVWSVQVSSLAGAVVMRSSAADAKVSVYQSTAADLNVTVAGYSTIVSVSTGSVRVHQSTAADLNVTVAGYSTTVNISSLAGPVIVRSSAANALVSVYQSTAADLNAAVVQGSTVWAAQVSSVAGRVLTDQNSTTWNTQARLFTSSGGGVEGSTTTPSTGGVLGLNVRVVMPSGRQSTTLLITSTHSTALYNLASSAAGLKHKVSAYFVGSTHTNPTTLVFLSSTGVAGAAIERWAINFGSGSSGITGANLAVGGGDFLFETNANDALALRIEGGSSVTATVVARVSIKWFTEA